MAADNVEIVFEVKNLCCLSGSQYLLNNISWQVKRGEQWVVFGRNGCGKTTLLSIIAGYKSYTSGSLKVLGQEYTAENSLSIRQKIGWISSSFFDHNYHQESVLDIVLSALSGTLGRHFCISNHELAKSKILLEKLGLREKMDYSFDMLSKGERQNVLIARALMSKPELLILDEPGTGLDVFSREYLLTTVKALAEKTNLTIIYVTHYVEEIPKDFDQCLLLKNGRIFKQGATKEVFQDVLISELLGYPVAIMAHAEGQMTLEVSGVHADIVPYLQ